MADITTWNLFIFPTCLNCCIKTCLFMQSLYETFCLMLLTIIFSPREMLMWNSLLGMYFSDSGECSYGDSCTFHSYQLACVSLCHCCASVPLSVYLSFYLCIYLSVYLSTLYQNSFVKWTVWCVQEIWVVFVNHPNLSSTDSVLQWWMLV